MIDSLLGVDIKSELESMKKKINNIDVLLRLLISVEIHRNMIESNIRNEDTEIKKIAEIFNKLNFVINNSNKKLDENKK